MGAVTIGGDMGAAKAGIATEIARLRWWALGGESLRESVLAGDVGDDGEALSTAEGPGGDPTRADR